MGNKKRFIKNIEVIKSKKKHQKMIKKTYKNPKLNINRIYCIAIPKRFNYINKILFDYFQFPKSKVTFIKPFLKDKLDREELSKKGIISEYCTLNMGEIACYLSHIRVLKQFLRSKEDYVIVFEDDLEKNNKEFVHEKINNIIQTVPKNFDIIYLGRYNDLCVFNKSINKYLYRTYYSTGMHSFIISRKGANKILKNCFPIYLAIDLLLSRLNINKKLICYCAKTNIFNQKRVTQGKGKFRSNLNNDRPIPPECIYHSDMLRDIKLKFKFW